jgi:hypothetical protein
LAEAMTRSAPRYSPILLAAVGRLDDERLPIAEVARRIGDLAGELGLPRPSYVHLRRQIRASRARRAAIAELRDRIIAEAMLAGVTRT